MHTDAGLSADVWQMTEINGNKKNSYTMWVKNDKPVMFEMMGYDSLMGSHYDKYYLKYDTFTPQNISDDIFKLPKGKVHLYIFYYFELLSSNIITLELTQHHFDDNVDRVNCGYNKLHLHPTHAGYIKFSCICTAIVSSAATILVTLLHCAIFHNILRKFNKTLPTTHRIINRSYYESN